MEEFVAIYSYLIIAIITFVAPLILFLMTIFSDGISIRRKKVTEQKKTIQTIFTHQITNSDGTDFGTLLDISNTQLKLNDDMLARQIRLLNPKRQLKRIFTPLLLSLLLLMVFCLIHSNFHKLYEPNLAVSLLVGSFVLFVLALIILQQVAWEIIDTKRMIEDEKNNITVQSDEPKK